MVGMSRTLERGKRGGGARHRRRRFDVVVVGALALLARAAAGLDFDEVGRKAQELAATAYEDPRGKVPSWLTELTYDQWRDIRFRPEFALWRDRKVPFQVQFFHPGLYYDRAIRINVVDGSGIRTLGFSPSQFDYGRNDFGSRVPQDLGYAGFRVHYPLKKQDYLDEVIVFLGATYFRAVGHDEVFGLSARGLAVDTAESRGEEFPYFREFWLMSPAPNAKEITIYGLLDSARLTGAYRFVVTPGDATVVSVEAKIFLRREVSKLGMAPLTSMFYFGENTTRCFEDFRPEVHDSDGLLLNTREGEWLWRPLDNPDTLRVSGFAMKDPVGFGLMQRDRKFDSYQDLETRAEQRPSAWVEPRGEWGPGRVELVEIPTNADTNDNIVAYWIPEKMPVPGEPLSFSYKSYWYGDDQRRPPGGRVVATRRDPGTAEGALRFVVDFAGGKLARIPAEKVVRGVVTVIGENPGELIDQHVIKNPASGGWRLVFQIRVPEESAELRAFLDLGGETLTETWSYAIHP
jgi:glucans biosynthesis protein